MEGSWDLLVSKVNLTIKKILTKVRSVQWGKLVKREETIDE